MEHDADRPQPPADQGLSSLGLIMTLAGSVMAPLVGGMMLLQIRVSAERASALEGFGSGSGDGHTLWLFCLLIASVVRSMVHRMAGLRLWRDVPGDPPALSGIRTYLIAAAAQTGLLLAYLRIKQDAPAGALLGTIAVMMAWPAAVYAVTRLRRFQALGPRPPVAQDNGFEGLAVLMAIFGFIGLVFSLMVVVIGFSARDEQPGMANILLLCGAGLTVRSIIHLSVGNRAVRGTAVNAASEFLRYGDVGIAIGAGAGGILTLWMFTMSLDIFSLALGVGVMLALMAWPAIVRRFVSWRQLADISSDVVRRRSPDAGVTALGWLLLAGAATALGSYVGDALGDSLGPRSTGLVAELAGLPFDRGRDAAWWELPLGLAQLWAALELLAVTPRRRLVASLWALAAVATTAITVGPDLADLLDQHITMRAAGFAAFLVAMTPAVATLLLVHRAPLPAAVARVKRPM